VYAARVSATAAVYLAAVLEYLTAEVMEVGGYRAQDSRRDKITPRHIQLAILNDPELSQLQAGITVSGGGVQPNMHPELLPKKKPQPTPEETAHAPVAAKCCAHPTMSLVTVGEFYELQAQRRAEREETARMQQQQQQQPPALREAERQKNQQQREDSNITVNVEEAAKPVTADCCVYPLTLQQWVELELQEGRARCEEAARMVEEKRRLTEENRRLTEQLEQLQQQQQALREAERQKNQQQGEDSHITVKVEEES
jgi:histone H2A